MATHRLYPTDITSAEATAGFVLTEIDYPNGPYHRSRRVSAIVYRCGPSHRLVKVRHPTQHGHYYSLEVFGNFHFDAKHVPPKWYPIRADYREADPIIATEEVVRWIQANPDPHYIVREPSEE